MNSKEYLSQEEIDALLRRTADDEPNASGEDSGEVKSSKVSDYLTPIEQDALGEIGNITFGSAATALSTLLGKKVEITTPKVSVILRENLVEEFPKPHVAVHVKFIEGLQGINLLVIKTSDAKVIADLMLGGTGDIDRNAELTEIDISAVQEAMNQMMGSSATSMSTVFNRFVNISPPGIDIMNLPEGEGDSVPNEDVFVKVSFRITIGDLIDSSIMQLLPVDFAKEMVNTLLAGTTEQAAAIAVEEPAAQTEQSPPPFQDPGVQQPAAQQEPFGQPFGQPFDQPYPGQPMQQPQAGQPPVQHEQQSYQQQQPYQQPYQGAYQQQPYQQPFMQPPNQMPYNQPPGMVQGVQRDVNVQPVQYMNLNPTEGYGDNQTNLDLLLDIPLRVTVELGRTKKLIKEILELSQGSIIELDKLAGEPVDILVNNKLIATGEVVVIDENFGVRVTDIISQRDRIIKLQ